MKHIQSKHATTVYMNVTIGKCNKNPFIYANFNYIFKYMYNSIYYTYKINKYIYKYSKHKVHMLEHDQVLTFYFRSIQKPRLSF